MASAPSVLDNPLYLDFTVSDPATGAAADADADPDIEIYEDDASSPLGLGITASKRDARTTGQYWFVVDLTAANGFEAGKTYSVYAIATVGGVTGKTVLKTFMIERLLTYFA